MRADQTRSNRLNELRKMAYRLSEQGKSPEYIVLSLKSKITQWGVSAPTARNYFETVARQIGK